MLTKLLRIAKHAPPHQSTSLTGGAATTHPMVGIVAVLLGALTSVFTSRLLAVGLNDVAGAIGASSDSMTWVSTAYNASNMFIGPITVYLGGLLGARRVLLCSSVVFMLSELFSPIVAHDFRLFVFLQAIAGLSAGTYYPLTMTLIVRHLPMKFLHLGIAAYALDILASTHIATALEGWYMVNLSWHWVFWNALLITPLLMICLVIGIPKQPLPQRNPKLSFWGFLYASLGVTALYIALDQGERLDWLNSPVVVGLLAGFCILTVATLVRHSRQPNPMVNLKFLATRNFLLLGAILVVFRFLLLSPTLLLPNFLALVQGYRPEQTGQALAWVAIPQLIAAPIAGLVLYRADSRLVCGLGFATVAFACLLESRITPNWNAETFIPSQLLLAIGLAFALTGLITTIFRTALALGALKSPINILTISCWFQTCRLFGAEIGKSAMIRFLAIQNANNYNTLAHYVDGGWLTDERIKSLVGTVLPGSSGLADAGARSAIELGSALKLQIGILSLSNGFLFIALAATFCMLLIGFMVYTPPLTPAKASG
jgi:DHA2 family multidrug resistance protein